MNTTARIAALQIVARRVLFCEVLEATDLGALEVNYGVVKATITFQTLNMQNKCKNTAA